MAAEDPSIRSLLIPMEDSHLLLPSTVVAEVVGYSEPAPMPGDYPSWLLGSFNWRGQQVPVVAFEDMNSGTGVLPATRARLLVLKALGDRPKLPYFAILAQGIPRLLRVHPDGIEDMEEPMDDAPAIRTAVLAHGEPAFIPDMEYVEDEIHRVLFR